LLGGKKEDVITKDESLYGTSEVDINNVYESSIFNGRSPASTM
jgi:hypothetical protein